MGTTEAAQFRAELPEEKHFPSGVIVGESFEAPEQVTGVAITAGLRSVLVEWDRVEGLQSVDGAGAYIVELDTVATFDSGGERSFRTAATVASFTDLATNTTYYARVQAVQGPANGGEWSATVSATTPLLPTAELDGEITETQIADDAVTTPKLAANAVTAGKLAAITMEVGKYLQSSNYDGTDVATGDATEGFRIEAGGDAEFYNVYARGTLRTEGGIVVGEQFFEDYIRFYTGAAEEEEPASIFHLDKQVGDPASQLYIYSGDYGSGQTQLLLSSPGAGGSADGEISATTDQFNINGDDQLAWNGPSSPSTSGITLGTGGTHYQWWQRTGKTLRVHGVITLGTGGGLAASSTPIKATVAAGGVALFSSPVGSAIYIDNSADAWFNGAVRASPSEATLSFLYNTGGYGHIGTNTPFTWASNDQIRYSIEYPIQ